MKKKNKKMFIMLFFIGLAIWFLKLIVPIELPGALSGFLSAISIVFILIGIVYMGWCYSKKINPYDFKD